MKTTSDPSQSQAFEEGKVKNVVLLFEQDKTEIKKKHRMEELRKDKRVVTHPRE